MNWLSIAALTFAALFPIINPFAALPLFASLTREGTPKWRKQMAVKASLYAFIILVIAEYIGNGLLSFFGLSLGTLQIAGGLIVAHTAWGMSTDSPKISNQEKRRIKRHVGAAMKAATVRAVSTAAGTVSHSAHHAGAAVAELPDLLIPELDKVTGSTTTETGEGGSDKEASSSTGREPQAANLPHAGGRPQESSGPHATGDDHGVDVDPPMSEAKLPDISFTPMAMPMLAGPGAMGVVIGLVARHTGAVESLGIAIGIAAICLLALLALLAATPINRWLGPGGVLVLQRVFGFITLGIAVALVTQGISSLFGIPLVN